MKMPQMQKSDRPREWEFCLALKGAADCTVELANALFEAGCDDATLSKSHGRLWLDFDRESESLEKAILTAIADVRAAGRKLRIPLDAECVDYCSLVTQAEIARRLKRSRQSIGQYVTGSRGPGNFPAAAFHLQEGMPLWDWATVLGWFVERGLAEQCLAQNALVIETINEALRQSGCGPHPFRARDPRFSELVERLLLGSTTARRDWDALHKRRANFGGLVGRRGLPWKS
jgi:hypothetical protein